MGCQMGGKGWPLGQDGSSKACEGTGGGNAMPAALSASSTIVNKVILSTFPFPVTLWLCHILVLSQASHGCYVLGTCLPQAPATHHVNQQKHLLPIMTGDPPIPEDAKAKHGEAFSDKTTLSCQKTNHLLSFMRQIATSRPAQASIKIHILNHYTPSPSFLSQVWQCHCC